MRLTFEILSEAPCTINPLKDRELDLRGLSVPEIENLGVTKDLNDAINLSDNDLQQLGNFPLLRRLKHLYVMNNRISTLDPLLGKQIPNLVSLTLTNNAISSLEYLQPLKDLPKLIHLSLVGNPVAKQTNYRPWVIHLCKKIRFIDFQRVTDKERNEARTLFLTPEGEPTQLALTILNKTPAKVFEIKTTLKELDENQPIKNKALEALTDEEQTRIREGLESASKLV